MHIWYRGQNWNSFDDDIFGIITQTTFGELITGRQNWKKSGRQIWNLLQATILQTTFCPYTDCTTLRKLYANAKNEHMKSFCNLQ